MSADIAKEADKPTPAQLVAEASVVVRLAATQWRPAYALARTIATIGDLQSAVTDLAAENARLREALERIAKDSPTEEPSREFTGNSDDDYHAGSDHLHWWYGRIAREALSPAPAKKENEHG